MSDRSRFWLLLRFGITCWHKTGGVKRSVKCTQYPALEVVDLQKQRDVTAVLIQRILLVIGILEFCSDLPALTRLSDLVLSTRTICSRLPSILGTTEKTRQRSKQCESSKTMLCLYHEWSTTHPVFSYKIFATVHGVTNKTGVPEQWKFHHQYINNY